MTSNTPETTLRNQICYYLDKLQIRYLVYDCKGSFNPIKKIFFPKKWPYRKGVSDLIIWHNDNTYFIELKAGKNKQTQEQLDFEAWIVRNNRCIYRVVYSLNDLILILK